MNDKERYKDRNDEVRERFLLARDRVFEVSLGEISEMPEALKIYFRKTALFLVNCQRLYQKIEDGSFAGLSLEECKQENQAFFKELFAENYGQSYANPDYAVETLGDQYGKLLCLLYTELLSERVFAFEQHLPKMTILHELFLEIYGMFCGETVSQKQLKETIYWFLYDYADEWCGDRVRELVDPSLDFATNIVMEGDLEDLRYIFQYGEYISDNELKMAEYLNSFEQEEIDSIARNLVEGYRRGFALKGVDLSGKRTVNLRYPIGFEKVMRSVITQFREIGLEPIIFRCAHNTLVKNQGAKIGYYSTSPNEQFDYDHRFDNALYFDKRMIDRKIACMRKAYEEFSELAACYAGPAVLLVFGEEPFAPESKENACRLSERQQNLTIDYSVLANDLMNEFIDREEVSFSAVAYPSPAIGKHFETIFHEIVKVNNLDNSKFESIQQSIIELLDRAHAVQILGTGDNMTNLTVSLVEIEDIEKETKFENCLADVNIPVGEVFTSPKLEGTNGLLHVSKAYLNGLCYKNLKITFENGKVTEYSCENFEDPDEGKAFIQENILYNRESLPMGEFAIGTNTSAYVMAKKYQILDKLPVLIAEKMGPHMALGDTCYAYSEDVPVFNPDGREVIARDNECTILRKTDPMKAYFNCHTDITIPYEEIGMLAAMTEHNKVPIIIEGRFVLEEAMDLNEPFGNLRELRL